MKTALAATLTGAAILATAGTAAAHPNEAPPFSPTAGSYVSGGIRPTPGAFPKSLGNKAWMRALARNLRANSNYRYNLPNVFTYRCERMPRWGARTIWNGNVPLKSNVWCDGYNARSGKWHVRGPSYDIVLWEDGSWIGERAT